MAKDRGGTAAQVPRPASFNIKGLPFGASVCSCREKLCLSGYQNGSNIGIVLMHPKIIKGNKAIIIILNRSSSLV